MKDGRSPVDRFAVMLDVDRLAEGFDVDRFVNGHDVDALSDAFEKASKVKGKPVCIVAKTVKGKGVSFMENQAGWHGKAPNDEQLEQAIKELEVGGEN